MRTTVLGVAFFLSAGFLTAGSAFAQPPDCASPDDPTAADVYAAKWRKIDGAWRLEAEIFSTENCGGTFCPDAEDSE